MITLFTGKPGTGKTYSLVRLALKKIKQGRDVYSNFHIDFTPMLAGYKNPIGKLKFWSTIDDLVEIKDGEILIDEAQIYMNSRKFWELPPPLMYKLQQHRKQGINIWGAVQNVKRLDPVIRELANSVYVCKKIFNFIITNEFDIEEIDKAKRKSYRTTIHIFNKKLANCFDTLQEISQAKNFPLKVYKNAPKHFYKPLVKNIERG